jgi:hypothetical protein
MPSVPPLTVMPPECVLAAVRLTVPRLESIERPPAPLITPVIVATKLFVSSKFPSPVKVWTVKFPVLPMPLSWIVPPVAVAEPE